jgi:hypothetical protein
MPMYTARAVHKALIRPFDGGRILQGGIRSVRKLPSATTLETIPTQNDLRPVL